MAALRLVVELLTVIRGGACSAPAAAPPPWDIAVTMILLPLDQLRRIKRLSWKMLFLDCIVEAKS